MSVNLQQLLLVPPVFSPSCGKLAVVDESTGSHPMHFPPAEKLVDAGVNSQGHGGSQTNNTNRIGIIDRCDRCGGEWPGCGR
jgi:hypothetical protein